MALDNENAGPGYVGAAAVGPSAADVRCSVNSRNVVETSNASAGSLAEMAQRHTGEAIRVLLAIVSDTTAPASARIAAAAALLDRGHGKAARALQVDQRVSFAQEFEEFIRRLGRNRRT